VSVDSTNERGLLGIAISKNSLNDKSLDKTGKTTDTTNKSNIKVFLYFTESIKRKPLRNRVYGYQWNGQMKNTLTTYLSGISIMEIYIILK
jgi:hypothetical protein